MLRGKDMKGNSLSKVLAAFAVVGFVAVSTASANSPAKKDEKHECKGADCKDKKEHKKGEHTEEATATPAK